MGEGQLSQPCPSAVPPDGRNITAEFELKSVFLNLSDVSN